MRFERVIRRRLRVDDTRRRLVADLDVAVAANGTDADGSAEPSDQSGPAVARSRSRTRVVQRGQTVRAKAPAAQEDTHE